MSPMKHAISHMGNAAALAKSLGVSTQAVCFWRDGLRSIPADKCPSIERLTAGAVRCEDLRPDVDWAYLRGTPAATAEAADA